jgi:citrate lyase subunit beta/citryl-CoA lyase/(S)-citramalyl-CoA lyase
MDVCLLYTPALRIDSLVTHRHETAADAIVIDFEDSTHVNSKEDARRKIESFDFSAFADTKLKFGARINTISTYEGLRDMQLLKTLYESGRCDIGFVLVPKVGHPSEVQVYRSLLSSLPFMPKVYTFIESVDAVDNADGIAAVSDALCFGQADLVADMFSPNEAFISYARARMCIAAARHNIMAIDTNSFEIHDMDIFREQCVRSVKDGFTGKAAIHPNQVPLIKELFGVTDQAVDKARSLVEEYAGSKTGFVIRDGQVVAPPFIAKARKMLHFYEKVGAR